MRIRHSFFNRALVTCFLIYAISPLSYVCPVSPAVASPGGTAKAEFKNFRIYFFEVILKGFFPSKDDETTPIDESVLVIKKLALARVSPENRQKPVKVASSVESPEAYLQSWFMEVACTDGCTYQSAEVPAYSGLSPPIPSVQRRLITI